MNSGYGLWLSSEPVDPNGSGYADLTDWFCILADENSTCSSSSSSALTSATSAIPSNASAATTSFQTSSSTSTSGASATQMAGSDSALSSSSTDSGLSTGAIAGIVLGALAGLAIILLVILWMLRRKHKERDAKSTVATAELNATTDQDRRPELGTDKKGNRHEMGGDSVMKHPVEKDGDELTSTEGSTVKKENQEPVEMP